MLLLAVVWAAGNVIAKSPSKPSAPSSHRAQQKYGVASGADQVLSAVYDPSSNSLRVEGGGTGTGSGAANALQFGTSTPISLSTSGPSSGQVLEFNGTNIVGATISGAGTVSSVGLAAPAIFTVGGTPINASGTLTLGLAPEGANLVFAGPTSGSAAAPTFRALSAADIPALNYQAPLSTYAAPANEFLTGFTSPNTFTAAQPSFANISGTLAASQCPDPGASSLGCTESAAAVSHEWINSISTSGVPALSQPAFSDISGTATLGQLPATLAQFTGTITAGDCAKWSSSGVLADQGAACGSGSGSAVIQVNGAVTTAQTPINFQSGGYITVANPSAGDIQFNFSGPLGVANGGTGLTSLGASGECLGTNGAVMQWQSCGSGSSFTAAGDLSGTSTSQSVIGLHFGSTELTLGTVPTSGQCLEYNGTNVTGAACSGGSGAPGGANTDIQFNNSGAFGGSANLIWNNTTSTLTITGTVNATSFVSTGAGAAYTQWTSAALSPGASGTVLCGANASSYLACSFNGGPVTLMPALANDLGGTDPTNPQVVGFHLTNEGQTGNSPITFSIANDTTTGTTEYKLAKVVNESGVPHAIATATTDTAIPVYMTASATAVSGNARLVTAGTIGMCAFDGAAVIGDYVVASTTTAGDCHDAGATVPSSGFIAGQVESAVAAAGSNGSVKSLAFNASGGAAFQANGTALSSSSTINFESGSGVAVSNPSAGNVSIAEAPAAMFFSGTHAGVNQAATANAIIASGFYLPYPVTFSHIAFVVNTADTTSGDHYDVGIYSHAGTLEADIGATAGTTAFSTTGSKDVVIAQASVTLPPGQYYFALTGNAATGAIDIDPCGSFLSITASSLGSSSGGALPSSLTPPADSFTTWDDCVDFALH